MMKDNFTYIAQGSLIDFAMNTAVIRVVVVAIEPKGVLYKYSARFI